MHNLAFQFRQSLFESQIDLVRATKHPCPRDSRCTRTIRILGNLDIGDRSIGHVFDHRISNKINHPACQSSASDTAPTGSVSTSQSATCERSTKPGTESRGSGRRIHFSNLQNISLEDIVGLLERSQSIPLLSQKVVEFLSKFPDINVLVRGILQLNENGVFSIRDRF